MAGTASQKFPKEFWEHQGRTCENEEEGEKKMEAWAMRGNICRQFKGWRWGGGVDLMISPLRAWYGQILWGHDVNSISRLKLPRPSLRFGPTRPRFIQTSQLMQEGGGASPWYTLCQGVIWQTNECVHTHTQTQGK